MGQVKGGELNVSLDDIEEIAKRLHLTAGKFLTEADKKRQASVAAVAREPEAENQRAAVARRRHHRGLQARGPAASRGGLAARAAFSDIGVDPPQAEPAPPSP